MAPHFTFFLMCILHNPKIFCILNQTTINYLTSIIPYYRSEYINFVELWGQTVELVCDLLNVLWVLTPYMAWESHIGPSVIWIAILITLPIYHRKSSSMKTKHVSSLFILIFLGNLWAIFLLYCAQHIKICIVFVL